MAESPDANDVVMGGGELFADGVPVEFEDGQLREAERIKLLTAQETAQSALEYIADTSRRHTPRTGFDRLDKAIGGLPPGTMFTVGGRTGSGKSSLLLAMGMNQCKQGLRVGIISCEDAEWIWGARILSHLRDVDPSRFFEHPVSERLVGEAVLGVKEAANYGLHFAFPIGRPVKSVLSAMRELVKDRQCNVIVVDYLQAIAVRGLDRYIARTDDAQSLKAFCYDNGVPLILASQLKRPEANPFREPTNSDLKDTGDLENMSEAIALLWTTSDAEHAPALGKISKVKWSPSRPRFELKRKPSTGALIGIDPAPEPQQPQQANWRQNGQG